MLTSRKIAELKPQEKRYTCAIGGGLSVKAQPTGTKSFVLRISQDGKVRDHFLGHFPSLTLAQARQLARRKKKEVGQTPPPGYTLRDAFKLWCGLKRGRIVSYQDEKRRLERYLITPIGSRQLDEITAPLVIHTVRNLDKSGKRATQIRQPDFQLLTRAERSIEERPSLTIAAQNTARDPGANILRPSLQIEVQVCSAEDLRYNLLRFSCFRVLSFNTRKEA